MGEFLNHFYPRSPCGERRRLEGIKDGQSSISIHALLAESDHNAHPETRRFCAISIHALLAESDFLRRHKRRASSISIHALLAESDEAEFFSIGQPVIFLSTLSLRRATYVPVWTLRVTSNFYPRSPCGERLNIRQIQKIENHISIHALLAESDILQLDVMITTFYYFYPRSPCGERRRGAVRVILII